MKKIIAMLLALVMLLSLAACASSGKTDAPAAADTAAPAETTDTTDTTPAADTKTDGKTYKVAMICDSSINDGGWGREEGLADRGHRLHLAGLLL